MGEDRQGRTAAQRSGPRLTHAQEGPDATADGGADSRSAGRGSASAADPAAEAAHARAARPAAERIVQVVPLLGARALAARVFDYRVPPAFSDAVGRGAVVVVPFGRRMVRGVVVSELPPTSPPSRRLLVLAHVACQRLGDDLLALAEHVRERYLSPIGAALQAVTPPHLANVAVASRTPREVQWLVPNRAPDDVEASRGAEVRGCGAAPDPQPAALAGRPPRPGSSVGRRMLGGRRGEGSRRRRRRPGSRDTSVRAGARSGSRGASYRGRDTGVDGARPGGRAAALERAATGARGPAETTWMLPGPCVGSWGVTGSGKTEVYLALLDDVLRCGDGAIVLVPEDRPHRADHRPSASAVGPARGRVAQRGSLPDNGRASTNASSAGRRPSSWARVRQVFAPRPSPCIVVDEAHDSSYKQEEEPRTSAS